MKSEVRIILALSFSLVACGHAQPELFLDHTTTALECGSPNAPDCSARESDAGAPRPELDECYQDGDCEDGESCERRHGLSQCQPDAARRGDDGDDGHAGHGGDTSSSDDDDDDDDAGHGGAGERPDAGEAACDPAYARDDHPKGSDGCARDEEEGHDDRSGSNSGPH